MPQAEAPSPPTMAMKMLIHITGNFVTCLRSTRKVKAAVSCVLHVPDIPRARFCSQQLLHDEAKVPIENLDLVTSLEKMGVDLTRVRKRHAVLLKKTSTHEQNLKQFLTEKGADAKMVASIISRYPQAITRDLGVLEKMWNVWKGVLESDVTILSVAQRSPESFFRTSNTGNLAKNIRYLQSLGLPPKVLSQLMVKSPRTFANSVDLNKQNVEYLLGLCTKLGGKDPREFVRDLISRNIYILTKSTNRIQNNIEKIKSLMKLDDRALLLWIQGDGSPIVTLSYTYFENNYRNAQEVLLSLGCTEAEISLYIFTCPKLLLVTPTMFANKIKLLMQCGVDVKEILNNPNILAFHINNIKSRIKQLKDSGYDFRSSGLGVLLLGQAKFTSKLERLRSSGALEEGVGE
ncbi:transcription termination factor 1, mitochondrial isoform X1 [Ranitomeya variabilis]|uniref:transcription termination factor 1, mitochondrial isoform X1 n=2 Tax=Ranitomeya variabilis TaxID=490064 RepID=UPI004055EC96